VLSVWEGRPQPLVALYRTSFAGWLRARLQAGERSPARALASLPHVCLPEATCRALDPRGLSFLNVNTPSELEAVKPWGL